MTGACASDLTRRIAAMAVAVVGVAAPAAAQDLDALARQILEIDQQAQLLDANATEPAADRADALRRRLLDAKVLFELTDYTRASILFLDVIEKRPDNALYDEALYWLGESLLQLRNLRAARVYYRQLADRPPSPLSYGALARLVEIALRIGEGEGTEEIVRRMGDLVADPSKPQAPYVRAKYLYFRERIDEALAAFAGIPDSHAYGRHARYFAATCRVKKGELDEAVKMFEGVLRLAPRNDGERRVLELARLGLGRAHYERGDLRRAIAAYQSVAQTSEVFATALQEVAWVYVADRQFENALRALDLLLLARPESSETPEVSLLMGNLLIRAKQFERAKELFAAVRRRYDPQFRDLAERMGQRSDPASYLDELLVGRVVGAVAPATPLPRLAAVWAREQPDVQRALDLLESVAGLERDLTESESILGRLGPAMSGSARARIFPELEAGLSRAGDLTERLQGARARLLDSQRAALPIGPDRSSLEALAVERRQVEAALSVVARTAAQREEQATALSGGVQAATERLDVLSGRIAGLATQMAAMQRHAAENDLSSAERASQARQLESIRSLIDTLREEEGLIRSTIHDARRAGGAEAPADDAAKLRRRLREIAAEERSQLADAATRAAPTRAARVDELLARAETAQAAIDRFTVATDGRVDERLVSVRATVEEQRRELAAQRTEAAALVGAARQAAAMVARDSFDRVLARLRDASLKGEVGLLDVAWALKTDRSEAVSRLVQEQKTEMEILEQAFDEVVRGGP